jgi:O-antigen/teichoic acid export membrane protein
MSDTSLTKQVATQWAAALFGGIAATVVQIALARVLGPTTFGLFSIATAVASIGFILQEGGFRTLLFREATRPTRGLPPPDSLLALAIGWDVTVTAIAVVASGLAAAVIEGRLGIAIAIVLVINCGRALSAYISAQMRAQGRFEIEALWQVETRAITTVAILAAALATGDLLAILAAGASAQVIVLCVPMVRNRLVWPQFQWMGEVWRICAVLIAIDFVITCYFRIDVLILAALGRPRAEIGVYSAAMRFLEAYVYAVTPIAAIFFRSARLVVDPSNVLTPRILILSILFAVPVLVAFNLTIFFGDAIVVFVYGPDYQSSGTYLPWIAVASFAIVPNFLVGQALLALNREFPFLLATLGGLAVNVGANLILIPASGALGAAQATAATEMMLLVFLTIAFLGRDKNSSSRTFNSS